ncbi:MAG: flagellar motor protein MotB [Planctomycetes bacterium ADurb.Bin401]|nr:MAG: flagellar motor protein MotB [Planctomycetes bacterium ADurb.Bin401]
MSEKPKKPQEEESGESAPLWIVSFADMISLLMAFFVMLTTFASFGPAETDKLKGIAKSALKPHYGFFSPAPRNAISPRSPAQKQADTGSEKPTLEEKSDNMGFGSSDLKEFRSRKVFLLESRIAFLAMGTTLSREGRNFLDNLAMLFKEEPCKIVISETDGDNNVDLGIARSMTVMDYLARKGICEDNCNISSKSITPVENFDGKRMLEIVMLDKGISG